MSRNLTIGLVGASLVALLLLAIRSLEPSAPEPEPAMQHEPFGSVREDRGTTHPPRPVHTPEPAEERTDVAVDSAITADHRSSSENPSNTEVGIGSLQGTFRKDIERVNRVLKAAGQPEIATDKTVSLRHLELLHDMVEACDKGINDCAERSLEFAEPFGEEMLKKIREDVADGKATPFQILQNGVIPKQNPHEILVTTAHKGVVYAGFVPQSNGLHEVLEGQRLAERARLESYMNWAAQLR